MVKYANICFYVQFLLRFTYVNRLENQSLNLIGWHSNLNNISILSFCPPRHIRHDSTLKATSIAATSTTQIVADFLVKVKKTLGYARQ